MKAIIFFAFILTLPAIVLAQSVPVPPHQFYGDVLVNGYPVSDGWGVSAKAGNQICEIVQIEDGKYGYKSLENLFRVQAECGDGKIIEFYVNDIRAAEIAFKSGELTNLNLSVIYAVAGFYNETFSNTNEISIDDKMDTNVVLDIVTNTNITTTINIIKYSENLLGIIGLTSGENYIKSIDIDFEIDVNSVLDSAVIKIYYADDEISGIDESNLRLYHYNEATGGWEKIENQDVNTIDNYVWANVTHLSTYGLFGIEETPPSPPGGGFPTGGGGPACTPDWTCIEWSECSSEGLQTRTCTDANNCGTTANKPAETEICTPAGPLVCTAGLRVCAGDELMECYEGNNWTKVETCEYGCSGNECNSAPATGTEDNITGPSGGTPTGLVLGVEPGLLAWVIGVIIILACGIYWFRRR